MEVPLRCFPRECRVLRFLVSIRSIDRDTDRPQIARSATQGIQVRLVCTPGCSLTRSAFTLRPGRLRMRSAGGRRVTAPVTVSPGRIRADLTSLFTDARGEPLKVPVGGRIDVHLTKKGVVGAGVRVRAAVRNKLSTCAVRNGRLAGCQTLN